MNRFRRSIGPGGERPAKPTNPPPAKISAPSTPPCATPTLKVEVGMSDFEWAATVARVTRERDDEHLARVEAEAKVERQNLAYEDLKREYDHKCERVDELRAVRRAFVRDNRDKTNTIRELQARAREVEAALAGMVALMERSDGVASIAHGPNGYEVGCIEWGWYEEVKAVKAALAAVSAEKEADSEY